jgi:hypothetical protein
MFKWFIEISRKIDDIQKNRSVDEFRLGQPSAVDTAAATAQHNRRHQTTFAATRQNFPLD